MPIDAQPTEHSGQGARRSRRADLLAALREGRVADLVGAPGAARGWLARELRRPRPRAAAPRRRSGRGGGRRAGPRPRLLPAAVRSRRPLAGAAAPGRPGAALRRPLPGPRPGDGAPGRPGAAAPRPAGGEGGGGVGAGPGPSRRAPRRATSATPTWWGWGSPWSGRSSPASSSALGYARVPLVEDPGTFAVRGGDRRPVEPGRGEAGAPGALRRRGGERALLRPGVTADRPAGRPGRRGSSPRSEGVDARRRRRGGLSSRGFTGGDDHAGAGPGGALHRGGAPGRAPGGARRGRAGGPPHHPGARGARRHRVGHPLLRPGGAPPRLPRRRALAAASPGCRRVRWCGRTGPAGVEEVLADLDAELEREHAAAVRREELALPPGAHYLAPAEVEAGLAAHPRVRHHRVWLGTGEPLRFELGDSSAAARPRSRARTARRGRWRRWRAGSQDWRQARPGGGGGLRLALGGRPAAAAARGPPPAGPLPRGAARRPGPALRPVHPRPPPAGRRLGAASSTPPGRLALLSDEEIFGRRVRKKRARHQARERLRGRLPGAEGGRPRRPRGARHRPLPRPRRRCRSAGWRATSWSSPTRAPDRLYLPGRQAAPGAEVHRRRRGRDPARPAGRHVLRAAQGAGEGAAAQDGGASCSRSTRRARPTPASPSRRRTRSTASSRPSSPTSRRPTSEGHRRRAGRHDRGPGRGGAPVARGRRRRPPRRAPPPAPSPHGPPRLRRRGLRQDRGGHAGRHAGGARRSKQVAVLVPTTVLAAQHERTFRERFKGYPVRIEALSRMQERRGGARGAEGSGGGARWTSWSARTGCSAPTCRSRTSASWWWTRSSASAWPTRSG